MIKMRKAVLNNNKQINFRSLSYEQKVKRIELITKVPLSNLKSNIAQSDLEQDDIQLPLCVGIQQQNSIQQKCVQKCSNSQRKPTNVKNFKKQNKENYENQINKVIKSLTKELGILSVKQTKQNKLYQLKESFYNYQNLSQYDDQQVNRSFTELDLSHLNNLINRDKQIKQFYTCRQNYSFQARKNGKQAQSTKKAQIMKQNIDQIPNIVTQKFLQDNKLRQINLQKTARRSANYLQISEFFNKQNFSAFQFESNKKFQRTKRNSQELNEKNQTKKQKFNRSNRKSHKRQSTSINLNNNQNQKDLEIIRNQEKNKNVKEFEINVHKSYNDMKKKIDMINFQDNFFNNVQNICSVKFALNMKKQLQKTDQKIQDINQNYNQFLSKFQQISKNTMFKKLQNGQLDDTRQMSQLVKKILKQYKILIHYLKKK